MSSLTSSLNSSYDGKLVSFKQENRKYYALLGKVDFSVKLKESDKLYIQIGNRNFADAPRSFLPIAQQFRHIISAEDAIEALQFLGKTDASMELYRLKKENRIVEITTVNKDPKLYFPAELTFVPTASSKAGQSLRILTSMDKSHSREISPLVFEILYKGDKHNSIASKITMASRKYNIEEDRFYADLATCLPALIAGNFGYFSIQNTDRIRSFIQPPRGKRARGGNSSRHSGGGNGGNILGDFVEAIFEGFFGIFKDFDL